MLLAGSLSLAATNLRNPPVNTKPIALSRSFQAVVRNFILMCAVLALTFAADANAGQSAAPKTSEQQNVPTGPRIWLADSQELRVTHVGATASDQALAQSVSSGRGTPIALIHADLDADGVEDLAVGFSTPNGGAVVIHRGNLDAFAPQSDASFQAIGRGQFPSPFLAESKVFQVPVQPDFLVAGDFTGNGNVDLAIASRGGNALYILPSDGKGKFGSPLIVHLSGSVTAVGAERLKVGQGFTNLVVGVSSSKSSSILILGRTQVGLGIVATAPIAAPASSLAFGDLGDSSSDVFFLAGTEVMVLHSASMQVEPLSLPVSAAAIAVGSFIYDRNPQLQIAVLGTDGSIQFAVHSEFDPRPFSNEEIQSIRGAARRGFHNSLVPTKVVPKNGWKVVERIPGVASFSSSQIPTFLRARISDHGSDDVMILNGSAGKLSLVFHPDVAPGDSGFSPAQISTRPYSGSPMAAVSSRVNVDGRPGIIAMHQGHVAPTVMMPLPDPTFTVNTTTDLVSPNACLNAIAGQCSLREAILEANATAGTDTIMVPAGTYTLTLAKVVGDYSGQHGALYVNDSVNIVGAGQATTIIQAGTLGQSSGTPNGVDMVMAVNEDISPLTNATASISNLTLQNGHNRGTSGNDGDGGCMEFDTGTSGNANLSLANVTLNNCDTTQGSGGGIAIFNFTTPGSGTATLSNTTVQNNSAVNSVGGAAIGGGVWVSNPANMIMTGSLVTGNKTTQVVGSNAGSGAGVEAFTQSHTQIHSSTISNNTAAGDGGGIEDLASLVVDQGTTISGNVAGNDGSTNHVGGGGIYYNGSSPDTLSLSKVTLINNSAAGNGGAIAVGNDSGGPTVTISFSRFVGNTSTLTPASNNIWNDDSTITATNNWWGSNSPAGSIDNVHNGGGPTPVTTFDPFISFAITASPSSIASGQTSTLTAGFVQDNHGTAIAASNLDVLIGLPITFNNAILGALSSPQIAIQSTGQATAIFTAGATGGTGHADAKVDQQTVTANITILAPLQITKSFAPATVGVGVASTLTFSVNNPNSATQDSSFTDTLPLGLVVAATPSVTNTCGGTVTAVAGAGSISFANANLPIGTCTITVHVSAAADGTYNNTVTINSTTAGTGAASTSSASLTVVAAPAITKSFGASTVPLNGSTSLTLTVTNSNANTTLTGLAFTDSLPAGLVVATPNGLSSTCTGTATATAGASAASLSGASLAPGISCSVSLNVTGTTAGVKNNSVQITSTNGGTGNTSNASITVVGSAVIIKAFGAASIPLSGATSLSFTIQNNNTTVAMTGVAFSDALPAGLIISTPNGLTGTCGAGTITATAGSGSASLSGGTIAASSSCTFSVNVTGTTAGTKNNTTGSVSSTEGGTGGTASASLDVVAPPSIAKAFSPTTIPLNGTSTLTFSLNNPAGNAVAETGVAFTDTLPLGLVVSTPNGVTNNCGGTVTAVAGSTAISLTGGTVSAPTGACIVQVNVTGTVAGNYTNTTGNVSSTNGGTGATATANLTVASPPAITKLFGAAAIPLNGTTSLTFNITNPNTTVALTGLAFTDNLPAGLVVATPSNLTSSCGGTSTAVAGAGQASLTAGTLAASGTCMVSLNVQGTTAGIKNNSVQVASTEGGTGNTSNASITVVGAPVIIKAFGAASVPLNGSTSLSFTVQNNNSTQALAGVGFSDTFPAGLVVSTPNGLTGSCGGGTITGIAGTNVVSLSGATLAASTSCTFSVNVTGITAGVQNNTTGNVTSTQGGTGGTASASLNVIAPPSIAKVFAPTAIALNATTSLSFTITNPAANTVSLTGVTFTDTLPTGLTVANASATVCGGTLTTTAPTGISLSGGTIAANSQCQFAVTVTGATSGQYTNTTGSVSSTNGGTGNTATANLTVASPPAITKLFGAISVPVNGSTSLSFTITNPAANSVSLTGVAFTDNLPAGLVVSTPNALTNTCGGTATATAGSGAVSLTGVTLATNASCTVTVNVTATTGGVKNNSVTVTSTNAGTGNTSNATLTADAPPVLVKSFGAASIPLNGSTSLSFTVTNPNATVGLTGIGFVDTLPSGLVVSTPNGQTGTCGAGAITAAAGSSAVTLVGASLPAAGACAFSVNVTGAVAGAQNNTTGAVTSIEGGTGGTASASVAVVAPPSISKAFTPTAINPNGTSALSFTIVNPAANSVALTGVAFADTLPAGVTISTPNGLTGGGSCGGTITANAGTGAVSLAGGTIAVGSTCSFSVNVTSNTPGVVTNTTSAVTSTNGGTGNTATANLTVGAPPSITKSFGAASIGLAGSTSLSFTITNPNASIALTGVAFTDPLPAGLVVSTPNGLTGTCGTGTITAAAGSTSVALTGGTIATTGTCTFSVNVTGVTAGAQINTTGAVSATNGGTGNTATANITVLASDLTITKSHTGNFFQGQTNATYTITVSNAGPGPSAGTVSVTDALPAGLTATGLTGTGWTCTVGTVTCTRTDALAANASYPAIAVTVSVAGNAAASVTNLATVSGGGELNTANDSASDTTTITLPPDFTLAIAPPSVAIRAGQPATYGLTITPINNTFSSAITFSVTGLPDKTSFVFTPPSVTPGANPATSSLKVLTTPGDPFLAQNNTQKSHLPLYAMFFPLTGLVLSGFGFRKRKLGAKWILGIVMFICAGFTMYGCASAGNFKKLGTTPGSYTVTVTATSGTLQHSQTVTLDVQP